MITERRTILRAVQTTAIAAVVVLLGADLASACHKKKRKATACYATTVAHGCYATQAGYGSYGGDYGSAQGMNVGMGTAGYTSYPMTSYGASYGGGGPAMAGAGYGYGGAPGMMGQTIDGASRAVGGAINRMGGVGRGIMGGPGYGAPGYGGLGYGGTPGTFGGSFGPGYGAGGVPPMY